MSGAPLEPSTATLAFYERCAEDYVAQTRHADMRALQEAFLARVAPGGRILDLGCGSGRDSKAFLARGYEVVAVDGAPALCARAAAYLGGSRITSPRASSTASGPARRSCICRRLRLRGCSQGLRRT